MPHQAKPTPIAFLFVLDAMAQSPQLVDAGVVLGNAKVENVWKWDPFTQPTFEQGKQPVALAGRVEGQRQCGGLHSCKLVQQCRVFTDTIISLVVENRHFPDSLILPTEII